MPVRAVVRESFVDFATVAIEQSAAALIAESTVARRATGHHNARKMPYEAIELDQNEQPRKISSCISLNFPDVQTISPINLTNFELQLKSHSDRRRVDYVLNGLRFGFQLGFHSHLCKLKSATSNCPLAIEHPAVIDEYYKELFPIVLACHVWGTCWARKRVEFQCDNTAVVSVIMSGTSKDEQLMHLLRALYLVSTRYNFKVTAKHVPGKTNRLADALSRFQMTEFFELAPQAAPKPVMVPAELLVRLTSQLEPLAKGRAR
jgi:hypothetical protein